MRTHVGEPRAGVVVGHKVPVGQSLVHLRNDEVLIAALAGRDSSRKDVWRAVALRGSELVEGSPEGSEKVREALAFGSGGRVLEVDIDTIETVVGDKLDGVRDEGRALASVSDEAEVARLGVGPATNGQSDLKVAVGHLQEVELHILS